MSYAATQKQQHIHVPWTAVITLGVAVIAVVAVLSLVNEPVTSTVTSTVEVAPAVAVAGAAAVPAPESPALRRQLAEEVATQVPQEAQFAYPRNHVAGTTLAPLVAGSWSGGPAIQAAPNDPHPLNHFPAEP